MNGLILFAGLILLLWIGSSIFIPLLVATFLWYLINATATYYRKLFPREPRHHGVEIFFELTSHVLSIARDITGYSRNSRQTEHDLDIYR